MGVINQLSYLGGTTLYQPNSTLFESFSGTNTMRRQVKAAMQQRAQGMLDAVQIDISGWGKNSYPLVNIQKTMGNHYF